MRWERGEVLVEPDERTTIEMFSKKALYSENNSVLTVRRASRKTDSGTYKVTLVSEAGQCEATGTVTVLDVPDKPRNFRVVEVNMGAI